MPENWEKIIAVDVSLKSSWILKLKWEPIFNSDKKGVICYKTRTPFKWYRTTYEVEWYKFQEILDSNSIGTTLHQEGLLPNPRR